ncbi:LysR substrate-binding domain-containing protein [Arthrobacter sp. ZGTC131]|uniref:LysR substrate-binding domain-containing protein n=1 Tax=Arthrobacter sp. ZGTC131 TaxID=2058898 RepID=UPI000CE3FD34|nr:LysR substrate-binding domain-containing protein [Arthrobacter sp. ZGTC131]
MDTAGKPPIENWLQLPALRLLTGIADHGSLSAAARAVGMAQSNATRNLKTLERRFGYTLINRSSRGSSLTQEGILTVEWAREVFEGIEKLAAGAAALVTPAGEELSVCASMTIAEYLLPTWLGAFQMQMPALRTSLRIMNSQQVIEVIQTGSSPLGFVETPEIPEAIQSKTVWTDRLVIVTAVNHPWAGRFRPLTKAELTDTPLIEREQGSGTRAFLDQTIGHERSKPIVEFNSNSAICQSAIAGLGPAVLSKLAVESALKAGRLVEIPYEQDLKRELKAIWEGPEAPNGAAGRFLDIATGKAEPRSYG